MRCRFCRDEAVARVALSHGCWVYPDDREQNLCLHHLGKASIPEGGDMRLVEDYTVGHVVASGEVWNMLRHPYVRNDEQC